METGYGIVLNARFINDCAPILFPYALIIRNAKKNRPFPGSRKDQVSASVFGETRKLSFFYIVEYRLLTLTKTDAEICHTYLRCRDR